MLTGNSNIIAAGYRYRYSVVAEGVGPDRVFNYDETNLSDQPGSSSAIFRKGKKYCETVRDHTKTAISLMFCASASGKLLPPYVVYKSKNFYPAWEKGGPKGAHYTCTKSGWFDHFCFEDWFIKVFLPFVRRLEGKKVLIGDNLSSHISLTVIGLCKENNIEFVCLPPNATDKMQPLDVGLFAPLKRIWRANLSEGRAKDPDFNPVQKTKFASELKKIMALLKTETIMPNAFAKCGLYPINKEKVLASLPSRLSSEAIAKHLDAELLKTLEVRRYGAKEKKTRGKKVPAGSSYTAPREAEEESASDPETEMIDRDEHSSHEESLDVEEELPDLELPRIPVLSQGSVIFNLF